MTVRQGFLFISVVLLLLVAAWIAYWPPVKWALVPVLALIALGIYDMLQRRSSSISSNPIPMAAP